MRRLCGVILKDEEIEGVILEGEEVEVGRRPPAREAGMPPAGTSVGALRAPLR